MFRIFLLASSVNDERMLMRQKMLTMICLLLGINLCYFIEFIMVTQRCDGGWNRTNVPIDINPFITHPAHERLYHTTRLYAPYSLWTEVWVLLRSTRIRTVKELPTVFHPDMRRLEPGIITLLTSETKHNCRLDH